MSRYLVGVMMMFLPLWVISQDCNTEKYEEKMAAADSCIVAGNYSLAYDNYNAAAVYCRDSAEVINGAKDILFKDINKLREEAEKAIRLMLANNLAYEAEQILQEGDRASAFKIASFAERYLDQGNHKVWSVLYNTCYYNDYPDRIKNIHEQKLWYKKLIGHEWHVNGTKFSNKRNQLFTSGGDDIKIWNTITGEEMLSVPVKSINSFDVSKNGNILAAGTFDGKLSIWEEDGIFYKRKHLIEAYGPDTWVNNIRFSPDGQHVVTGGFNGEVKLWEVKTGKLIRAISKHSDIINSLEITSDGKYLIVSYLDNKTRIWDWQEARQQATFLGVSSTVHLSDEGIYHIATGDGDGYLRFWNLISNAEVPAIKAHDGSIRSIAYSPNGEYLVTAANETIKLWEVSSGDCLKVLNSHTSLIDQLSFSPDGRLLVSASRDHTAIIWDLSTSQEAMILENPDSSEVRDASFSPNGKHIVTANADFSARIWDVKTGKETKTLLGHEGMINEAMFSSDNRYVLTGSKDKTARTWDAVTGQQVQVYDVGNASVNTAIFSPDNKFILTGAGNFVFPAADEDYYRDESVILWDREAGSRIYEAEVAGTLFENLTFSPDGSEFLVPAGDGKIIETTTGRILQTLSWDDGYGGMIYGDYSSSGNYLISCGYNEEVKIWDTQTRLEVFSFDGKKLISTVEFSPNGQYALTSSSSFKSYFRLFDVNTGLEIFSFEGHQDTLGVSAAKFSPDGQMILTAGNDGCAKVWNLSVDKLMKIPSFSDNFSPEEIKQYDLYNTLIQVKGWEKMIASASKQQLRSFAMYFEYQMENNVNPRTYDFFYAKAQRCYQAARDIEDSMPLIIEQADMTADWAYKLYKSKDESSAKHKIEEAINLYQEVIQQTDLYNSRIRRKLEGIEENGLNVKSLSSFLVQLK